MRAQIKKRHGIAFIEMPLKLMKSVGFRFNETVDVTADVDRIIIKRLDGRLYDLDRMVAAMSPATFPEPVDFGPPRGKEAL